jgi:signal transduction histidine kinase
LFQKCSGVVLVLLACWLCVYPAKAQQTVLKLSALTPVMRQFSSADGLPISEVRALTQDAHGAIWVGTYAGLVRFDGQEFELMQPKHVRLPLAVESLSADAQGNVWVGTVGHGLWRYRLSRRDWFQLRRSSNNPKQAADLWSVAADRVGGVWFGGYRSGLQRLRDKRSESIAEIPADWSLTALLVREREVFAGGLDGRIFHLSDDRARLCEEFSTPIRALGFDRDQLWVVNDRFELWRIADCQPGIQIELNQAVATLSHNARWIGLAHGVAERGATEQSWIWFASLAARAQATTYQVILEDHEGGVWFGSRHGLEHVAPNTYGAQLMAVEASPSCALACLRSGLVAAPVRAQSLRGDALWLAAERAPLMRWRAGELMQLEWPSASERAQFAPRTALSTADALWIGHMEGLARLSVQDDLVEPLPVTPLAGKSVMALAAHDGGVFALAQGDAAYWLDADGQLLKRESVGSEAEFVWLQSDRLGVIWFASKQGIYQVRGASMARVSQRTSQAACLSNDGSLLSYQLGELSSLDHETRARTSLRSDLPVLESAAMLCGDDALWLFGQVGAWRMEQNGRGVLSAIEHLAQVPSRELLHALPLHSADGALWASSSVGMMRFDLPHAEGQQSRRSVLESKGLRVERDGIDRMLKPGAPLRADDRRIRLEWREIALSAHSPPKLLVSLIGPNGREQFTSHDMTWQFSQLPAGRYRISGQLLAAEALGAPAEFAFEVVPLWWQSASSRLGLGALLGAALLLAWRYQRAQRLRQLRRSSETQASARTKLKAEQSARLLSQASHELRNLFGGVHGMSQLLRAQKLDERAARYASKLGEAASHMGVLLDELMENARLGRGQLLQERRPVDVVELMEGERERLSGMAEAKGLQFRLLIDTGARWRFADALRFKQILLNLALNALRYTKSGFVELELSLSDPAQISLQVRDSGPGIPSMLQSRMFEPFALGQGRVDSTGLGLSLCKQLAEHLRGSLSYRSLSPGSEFTLRLPFEAVEPPV